MCNGVLSLLHTAADEERIDRANAGGLKMEGGNSDANFAVVVAQFALSPSRHVSSAGRGRRAGGSTEARADEL